jgi:hypothetical protein
MRRGLLIAASLAAGVSGASAAELRGTIKSIDFAKDAIALANGMTFVLPKSLKPGDLTVGEKVKVTYEPVGKANVASRVVDVP